MLNVLELKKTKFPRQKTPLDIVELVDRISTLMCLARALLVPSLLRGEASASVGAGALQESDWLRQKCAQHLEGMKICDKRNLTYMELVCHGTKIVE
ncbi:hypothetical protein CASFOL_023267 [Castilleja foliolosa]|uniref:Uncharacterized protein n=1 Tax=Castilleja foliolosa TaxID=1961234 RepID=A0ABD3CK32_9LAMI